MLNVNSIFTSVQGEGKDIGREATFIRFAGCNLGCVWCDTKAARNGEGERMDWVDVCRAVPKRPGFVVLTGGEPMIQPSKDMENLVRALHREGKYLAIETNGAIVPEGYGWHNQIHRWSISPKLSSSGNAPFEPGKIRDWVNFFKQCYKPSQFKFVIANIEDMKEAISLTSAIEDSRIPVIFQPEASKLSIYGDMVRWWNELNTCPHNDVRFLIQMHKAVGVP